MKNKRSKPSLPRRRFLIIAASLLVVIICFVICFFSLDMRPVFSYKVSLSNISVSSLNVELTVSVPLFCKREAVFLYLGDKDITVLSCTDSSGNIKETFLSDEGFVTIPVTRASKINMVYDVSVAVAGKHGSRGIVSDTYAVFDGEQAFLLPAEFNLYSEAGVRDSVGKIRFSFDFPKGWAEIVPFRRINNPSWMDIYAITKNAFVFGGFDRILSTPDGLKVYALSGQAADDTSGFSDLFAYYKGLFATAPPEFNIVLLPPDSPGGSVIGGSGTGTVAASFDRSSLRDWQLLSHRLFHAFYDNAAPYVNVHVAPNIWLNEGLATYYENLATDALPEPLKSSLGVDVDRQLALTFNQYLYMRLKEPFQYNFSPMDEDRISSAAMIEFLHYTAAPLIVKAFENESTGAGNPPDALLRYCLEESAFVDRYTAIAAALELLGEKGVAFCDSYMLGMEIPPLWDLKVYQPSPAEILDSLNYIEILLANWQQTENIDYPADLVSEEELRQAMDAVDNSRVPVMSYELDSNMRKYSPELYSLIKDYYRRASDQGFDLNDRELRFKLVKK